VCRTSSPSNKSQQRLCWQPGISCLLQLQVHSLCDGLVPQHWGLHLGKIATEALLALRAVWVRSA